MNKGKKILESREKFVIKLGLERIEKILSLLNNPQNNYKIIHIAGTNGKGSTSKIINDILIDNGFKVGLYTSPHLFSYEERIRVNNEEISSNIFNRLIEEINNLALNNDINLSEFELLSATCFYYFYIKKVDYVVLETGLGGLFDATNVVQSSICVITTIDFDHKERLGDTIEKIATQKAGIIKNDSIVVVDKDNLGFSVVEKIALEKNAKINLAPIVTTEFIDNKNYFYWDNKKIEFSLLGAHQAKNLALALKTAQILGLTINESIFKNIIWNYRMQFDSRKKVLIDCAHNPSGAQVLRNFLDENFKNEKKTFIFGCLKHKEYKKMLKILLRDNDSLYFVEFDHKNALKLEDLDNEYKKFLVDTIPNDGLRICTGSIYMLGEKLNSFSF